MHRTSQFHEPRTIHSARKPGTGFGTLGGLLCAVMVATFLAWPAAWVPVAGSIAWAHGPERHNVKLVPFDTPVAAPAFSLPTVQGENVSLEAWRGHTVVLNFWATWCAPCVREMPSLERLAQVLKDERFVVVAVSLDAGGAAQVQPFLRKLGVNFPVVLDPRGDVGEAYGARDLPTTFVLDTDGRVVAAAKGERAWDAPEMIEYLREVISRGTRG